MHACACKIYMGPAPTTARGLHSCMPGTGHADAAHEAGEP